MSTRKTVADVADQMAGVPASKGKSQIREAEIQVLELTTGRINFAVLGTSPLIFNRMAEKAKRDLLMPRGRKTALEKLTTLKHDPLAEYRDSVYRDESPDGETRLMVPAPSFKGAMMTAALEIPGVTKASVERLTWVEGYRIAVYGVPQLFMATVIQAGMTKAPDIRTRAILPRWACVVSVSFVEPRLTAAAMGNLLAAGGIIAGIGDFRQEKGRGSFGQFRLVEGNDKEFAAILRDGGREAQDAALTEPGFYDDESRELLDWYLAERDKRSKSGAPTLAAVA